jgi:MoaA/NifB/PqqE/SkfB family radical SAM enzyme
MAPPPVLVVHPPLTVARDFIDYPYFSDLGAVQLAAVLRTLEFPVALVDAFALEASGLSWRPDGRALLGIPPEVLFRALPQGFTPAAVVLALTPFHRPPARDPVLGDTLRGLQVRYPAARLVLADLYQSGQHYVEAPAEQVLRSYPEAHAWVKYEAEDTLPALLRAGVPAGTHHGQEVPALDALPAPAWDLVDLAALDRFRARVIQSLGRGAWAFPIDGRTVPMVTSRGCPFRCVHCSSNPGRAEGSPKTQRRLDPEALRARLTELVRVHGATRVALLDELANVNERHWDTLLETLVELGVQFDLPNGLRADYLTRRHLQAMKGRVHTVSVSAESGVQRVVTEVVQKRLDLREITRVAQEAQAEGVRLLVHYIVGLPGESAEEINGTLGFALDLHERFGAWPAVQYATPLPGTGLARGRSLPVVDDWGPRFQRTPSQPGMSVPPETLERFLRAFRTRLEAHEKPQKVIMNVTYVCNNHCTFCAVGTRTQVDGHPTRQREHLEHYRAQGVTMVDFDGGEPTLNPELLPLIGYARALGYDRVTVTTNGRRCAYRAYARALVRSGLTTLLFSVHGPDAQTHAQQVGVAEAFDQTTEGIRNARRYCPAQVELGMNITLTKGNHRKLEDTVRLAWDLGLRWMNVQFLTPFGRATRWTAPDTQEAADIARGVIARWRDRMKFQVVNLPFCFLPGLEELLVGDLGKHARHMVFVNNDDVNLAEYLAARRVRKPVCAGCPQHVVCGGFYELEDVPEPPWLVRPEDLLRPVRRLNV